MKLYKITLACLVLIINLVIAQPSWADRLKFTQLNQYTEVTQKINELLTAKATPETSNYTPAEIETQLGELKLQKYILESASSWAQCLNQTGKTLGIYTHKPKKSAPEQEGSLYFLGDGDISDRQWNCDGVYLPTGVKIAHIIPGENQPQELTEPLVIKIVPGTQLVVTSDAENGTIELNVPPAKIVKAGDGNLLIPNFSLAEIDTQVPNAPIED